MEEETKVQEEEAGDVATIDEVNEHLAPQVFDLPNSWGPTKRSVVGLACFNVKTKDIAKQLSLSEWTVRETLRDTEVRAITARGATVRKMFISSMAEVVVARLFQGLDPKELDKLNPKERVDMIEKCVKIIQNLNVKPMKEEKNEKDLVDDLKKDAAEQAEQAGQSEQAEA